MLSILIIRMSQGLINISDVKESTVQACIDMNNSNGYWYNTQLPDIKSKMSLTVYNDSVNNEIDSIISNVSLSFSLTL